MRCSTAVLGLAFFLLLADPVHAGPLDDADADSFPDAAEPTMCRANNWNLNADGTCPSDRDFQAPTDEGINEDYAGFREALCIAVDPGCQVVTPPESLPLPPNP